MGPLSKKHRVISLSLRRFFPEHWDGVGNDYLMAQHVADVIAFIEQIEAEAGRSDGPFPRRPYRISRGAAAAGSVAQAGAGRAGRRSRCFADTAGAVRRPARCRWRWRCRSCCQDSARRRHRRRARSMFVDAIDGDGAWARACRRRKAAAARQYPSRCSARPARTESLFTKAQAGPIRTPTLFIGGGNTTGSFPPRCHRVLARHFASSQTVMMDGAKHWMFDEAAAEILRGGDWSFWRVDRFATSPRLRELAAVAPSRNGIRAVLSSSQQAFWEDLMEAPIHRDLASALALTATGACLSPASAGRAERKAARRGGGGQAGPDRYAARHGDDRGPAAPTSKGSPRWPISPRRG